MLSPVFMGYPVYKQTVVSVGKEQSVVHDHEPQHCLRTHPLDRDEAPGPAASWTRTAHHDQELAFWWLLLFASEVLALELKVLAARPAGPRSWRLESQI